MKPKKLLKYPRNLKITKIPPKHKKLPNDQNNPETQKMTKILPKPKK